MSRRSLAEVALVTGATDGIGRATAIGLAQAGWQILVHGRQSRKVAAVVAEIRHAGGAADGLVADLTRFSEVRTLADEVQQRSDRLPVLLGNAGVFEPQRTVTEDGHETTFQVNYLSQALLVFRLLPMLRRSAPARILLTSSVAHRSGRLVLADLDSERRYSGYDAYAASKVALNLFARALAGRLRGSGVTCNTFHPGVIGTKLLAAGFPAASGHPPAQAARLAVRLAIDPSVERVSGRYFEQGREIYPSPQSRDDGLAEQLWSRTVELLGEGPAADEQAQPSPA